MYKIPFTDCNRLWFTPNRRVTDIKNKHIKLVKKLDNIWDMTCNQIWRHQNDGYHYKHHRMKNQRNIEIQKYPLCLNIRDGAGNISNKHCLLLRVLSTQQTLAVIDTLLTAAQLTVVFIIYTKCLVFCNRICKTVNNKKMKFVHYNIMELLQKM